jgi:NAD(P)-dependent dehydrogenase (short-subunit alcohol dehydrogenase family)
MSIRVFKDSVAIVTGAASGIGRALSEQLALAGAHVILADLQTQLVEDAALSIRSRGGHAISVEVDVCDFGRIETLVQRTVEEHGRIDFLFNNAGIGIGGNIEQHTAQDWDRIIDVNLKAVAYGVQAVIEPMMTQGFGHIVNTASISGLLPTPGVVAYSATKHGVVGLSKSLRGELRSTGVRVSALCPGAIDTPLLTGGNFGKFYGVSTAVARHTTSSFSPMDPERFAVKALEGVRKNRALIVIPWQYRLMWLLLKRLPPSWEISIVAWHMAQRRKEGERIFSKVAGAPPSSANSDSHNPSCAGTETGD